MQTTRTYAMPVEEKAMPVNEKFLPTPDVEDSDCPWWGNWKVWFAVSVAELDVIIILAVGMAHFALHVERGWNSTNLPDRGMLTSLERINQTLEDATKRWRACQDHTRMLETNSSTLRLAVAQLNASVRLKESENHILQEEVTLLRNWTHRLQDLNNQQKEIIDRFHQQKERLSCGNSGSSLRLHCGPASLMLLTLAGVLWV
ncbi:uncharacterized protein [Tiliqua scincoides]|uniref:uncharacterized protein n=1 Tax=Tiliqua scincoides TaxID=71010 RepID=UPI0034626D2E